MCPVPARSAPGLPQVSRGQRHSNVSALRGRFHRGKQEAERGGRAAPTDHALQILKRMICRRGQAAGARCAVVSTEGNRKRPPLANLVADFERTHAVRSEAMARLSKPTFTARWRSEIISPCIDWGPPRGALGRSEGRSEICTGCGTSIRECLSATPEPAALRASLRDLAASRWYLNLERRQSDAIS